MPAAELFYLGQKIPDIQRPWDSADYRQMIAALQEIDETQVNALPRRNGELIGSIYQRMVSEENFWPPLNIYAPLELRQLNREDLVLYSAELAKRMPELLVHLGSDVRGQLLARVAELAEQPPTPRCAPAWANSSWCRPASSRMWKANWPSLPRRRMPAQLLTSAHHPQLQRNKPRALARATAWVRRSTPSLPLI